MKLNFSKNLAAALGVGMFVTLIALPQARGELVYEDQQQAQAQAPSVRADEREQLRQVLSTSQKAQNTVQAQAQPPVQIIQQQPAPIYVQQTAARPVVTTVAAAQVAPVQTAPVYVQQPVLSQTLTNQPVAVDSAAQGASAGNPAASGDVPNLSKTEMMRRERVREELKNEDSLEERLEELRLRDEQRRTNQILGTQGQDTTGAPAPVLAPAAQVGMQNEAIAAPVTEHPGEMVQAPALPAQAVQAPQQVQVVQPAQQVQMVEPYLGTTAAGQPVYGAPVPAQRVDQLTTSSAMAVSQTTGADAGATAADKTNVSVSGRVGLANMSGVNGFTVNSTAAVGVEAGVSVTDYLTLTGGYQYASFGISLDQGYYGTYSNPVTNTMNSNLYDFGAKINLLGPDAKIRPFIAAGAGYQHSYINYASSYQSYGGAYSPDYDLNQWLGYVGGGLDFKVSKNISLGIDFRYFDVISNSQSGSLNPYAYGTFSAPINQAIGSSLATQGYYTAGAALTFTF